MSETDKPGDRHWPGLLLFAATSTASAFLIFLVQPLVGKRILPWFGGVPAVWSLCLAFYQTALFAGYAYAHALIRFASPGRQLAIHAAAIGAAALALPVLPGDAWKPGGGGDPSAAILALLIANVALPFLVLAATGPLVAAWFARRYPQRSPYPLYAVSNAGSLLALLAYPFLLEPRLALSATGRLWSAGFTATGAAVLACAILAWRAGSASAPAAAGDEESIALPPRRVALWIGLSAGAVVLLLGVTHHLCLDVASIPFLWIIPLAVYLTTLIASFGAPRVYRRIPCVLLAVLAYLAPELLERTGLRGAFISALGGNVPLQVARNALLLFSTCMVLHGELYRLRPAARSLTTYYLCMAGGGALGGIAVGIGAPRVFDGFYELPLGLALTWLLLLAACRDDVRGWLGRSAPGWRWIGIACLTGAAFVHAGGWVFARPAWVLHQERSFFGVLRVEQSEGPPSRQRSLKHGSTLHGLQLAGMETQPTSYYGVSTGIGIALTRGDSAPPARIGVIGLGIGTLAAYGRPGDHVRFFEIDPAVIRIARDEKYFSYLARSAAEIEIVEGDARISLARERAQGAPRFDYLIVDAYSSDAVPVHLLTREALALYLDSLRETGLIAIHTSSRYFDLFPVLARLASDAGLHVVKLLNPAAPKRQTFAASWVMIARDEARIRSLAHAARQRHRALGLRPNQRRVVFPTPAAIAQSPLWTDDYSDLVRALSWRPRPPQGDPPPPPR